MDIGAKFKETAKSVLPVIIIVLALGLTIVPLEKTLLARFALGGLILIFGLTIFLMGVGMGIEPMGERCGAALVAKKNLPLLLSCAFVIGFIVTAAEPDIQVFADQVVEVFPFVNKNAFTFSIATGVGIFLLLGLLRSVLNFPIKIFFFVFYTAVFALALLAPQNFLGIAFDSGGATTGPMTVPFIISLGLGVSAVRAGKDDSSFGLTGTASIGPVMAVLAYSIFLQSPQNFSQEIAEIQLDALSASGFFAKTFAPFINVFPIFLRESLFAITPLVALFIIFQIAFLKMTARQVIRILVGFFYTYVGLSIFLTGVSGGFSDAGRELGKTLGYLAMQNGGPWLLLLIATGIAFGAIIVCAEPAVWVLSEQVEQVSGGTIKRKALLVFLSAGTAIAIAISLLANVFNFNIKWVLLAGYSLSMTLMIFCPPLWTGIAFDSGGVASGPLTSTFILSFTIGSAAINPADSFGVIALVAMMPLSAIQIMGIIYKAKQSRKKGAKSKEAK